MANLWRVLALAWLGGIASPMMTGDPQNTEIATLTDTEDPSAQATSRDHDRTEDSARSRDEDANAGAV